MFIKYKTTIEEGDHVIAYSNPVVATCVVIQKDKSLHNKFGQFEYNKMIGKPFGSKIPSVNKKGFIYILHPTPELWTSVLPHRTQILYLPDIALISSFLNLEPGVKMIECGTGSGSFSTAICRSIQPHGHLFTYEYHEERVLKAKDEFEAHGFSDIVTITCRDVIKDGFGLDEPVLVSAAFLDLPAPWEALEDLVTRFDPKKIGRLCCFSPCIEQVQKTVAALGEHGFFDITMHETLIRHYDSKTINVGKWNDEVSDLLNPNKRKTREDLNDSDEVSMFVTRPKSVIRGHTSYLTFAKYSAQRNLPIPTLDLLVEE